ncbi:retrovirus-related pol polyprotein from transposon tnt 1-94 [Lasius niger]|uniref:Retrovirus-related pol polyprotein from transposon tnt 1-94 n=1 Tax=Lasius niger TaxID=67767 RepID=A0A0J7K6M7_LASNI|nr:retrovirus-related pol polyprotein from transposon tnt 1-94 [Lasius niger]
MPDNEAVVQARPRTSALGGIKIAKLKGTDNYQIWKFQVENLLRHERLWMCVNPPRDAQDIDAPVEDSWLVSIIMRGLPKQFDGIVQILDNTKERVTSEDIMEKLMHESLRQQTRDSTQATSAETAFVAKSTDQKKFIFKCFNCGGNGHKANVCKKPKGGFKKQKDNVKASEKKDNVKASEKKEEDSKKSGNWALSTQLTTMSVGINSKEDWMLDSCSSAHMSMRKDWFEDFNDSILNKGVTCADKAIIPTGGTGNAKLKLNCNGAIKDVKDVIYVPGLAANLLSVAKLTEKGLVVVFSGNECRIFLKDAYRAEGEAVATGSKCDGVFKLDAETLMPRKILQHREISDRTNLKSRTEEFAMLTVHESKDLWHKRLGHINEQGMTQLMKKTEKYKKFSDSTLSPCESCILGKHARKPFPISERRASKKLELLHSDLCGPMSIPSIGGARYLLTLIDDHSRMIFGYFIKSKDQVLSTFKDFKVMIENQSEEKIKCIRTDNGREYVNKDYTNFLTQNGIRHELSCPYTPQQNGRAERVNRTLVEIARCLMTEANLDPSYWSEAINTAIYLKNRWPCKVYLKINLRLNAFAHIPKELRKKLDPKSQELIFVGYSNETKGYRLINPKNPRKIITSRDVKFIESKFPIKKNVHEDTEKPEEILMPLSLPQDREKEIQHVEDIQEPIPEIFIEDEEEDEA